MLSNTPTVSWPQPTLRGNAAEVHGMSLMVMAAIVGIVVAAAVIYLGQPRPNGEV